MPVRSKQLELVWNMFTVNNKDTGTTPWKVTYIFTWMNVKISVLLISFEEIIYLLSLLLDGEDTLMPFSMSALVLKSLTVFDQKNLFWENLVQKIKTVSLSRNLVPWLILICRIQWWSSLFPFLTGDTLFGQTWSIKSKLSI